MDQKISSQDQYYNIVKDLENVDGVEEYDSNLNLKKFKPYFDPKKYAKENQPLLLDNHKLDDVQLKHYAEIASSIRKEYMEKAKELDDQLIK